MAQIDVVVSGFLLTKAPLKGTQDAQIPAPVAARHLYSREPPIPSNTGTKESTSKSVQQVTEKDFEVFYHSNAPRISQTQPQANMGFEERTPNLLALLTAYTGGATQTATVTHRPLNPVTAHTLFLADATEKKRKRGHEDKVTEVVEEGEIADPPVKEA